MEERCVFCGAAIPAGAMYCQDCAVIVEGMTDDQRRALAAMLADEIPMAALCQAWDTIKECFAVIFDFIKNAAAAVIDWFMETDDQQGGC